MNIDRHQNFKVSDVSTPYGNTFIRPLFREYVLYPGSVVYYSIGLVVRNDNQTLTPTWRVPLCLPPSG